MQNEMFDRSREPLRNTYQVNPSLWAGEYPGSRSYSLLTATDLLNMSREKQLQSLLDTMGVNHFVDLTANGEHFRTHKRANETVYLTPYAQLLPGELRYSRFAIRDVSVPTVNYMVEILSEIQSSIAEGRTVYVHCRGGIGRTGTVIGCYLAQWHGNGFFGKVALDELTSLRRDCHTSFSPETGAQVDFVRHWAFKRVDQ